MQHFSGSASQPDPKNFFIINFSSIFSNQEIDQLCPKNTQKLLFSATYSEAVIALALNLIPDSLCIRLKPTEEAVDDISHYYFLCNSDDSKFEVLCKIYSTMSIGQSIIFCRTRKQVIFQFI